VTRRLALVALAIGLWSAACGAQTETPGSATVTVDAAMVKGAAEAPVTIVEFSDYQ